MTDLITKLILVALAITIEAIGVRLAINLFTDVYISLVGAVALVIAFNLLTDKFSRA